MRVLIGCVVLASCVNRDATHIIPLAELQAEMQLGSDDRVLARETTLRLHPEGNGEYCAILSPRNARAVLDGTSAKLDAGGGSNNTIDDMLSCLDPAFVWENPPETDGPSTFEITDGSTTWTFVVWQPFASAGATLVSHPDDQPIRVGDTVVFRANGPVFGVSLVARDGGTTLFELDESSGLTVSGMDISFVMPAVTATSVSLRLEGELEKRIDRCDATLGCQRRYPLRASPLVTIEPSG